MLISQIMEDLGYSFYQCTASQIEIFLEQRDYDAILSTHDISLTVLKKIRTLVKDKGTKFILLGGGAKETTLCNQLKQNFHFDLVAERPIKSSLFATQVQAMFEVKENDLELQEKNELYFLNHLKGNYVGVLDARIESLELTISSSRLEGSHSLRTEAWRLAHNMRGTASSCGLALIASIAGKIEDELSGLEAPDWLSLGELCENLRLESRSLKSRYSDSQTAPYSRFAMINVLALLSQPLNESDLTLLASSSINFVIANTAAEFLEKSMTLALDAVFVDLNCTFPVGTGFDLATMLREEERFVDLPIGFIQDSGSDASKVLSAHAGGALLLQRPLTERSLVDATSYLVGLNSNGRPRILVVDDDEDFTSILASTLGAEGMIVKSTTNPLAAESLLQEFGADLLIIDANMPQQNGIEICRQIRSQPRWADLPILFLTAEKGIAIRIEAYEAGADDYLSKPLIVPELLSRVKGRLERLKLLKERMGKDALTGLLLRRSFVERVEDMLQDALRYDYKFTICLLDLDNFKLINDTYGHATGDEVLTSLGRILGRRFRAGDLRGRWGGEEFILAFPHTTSTTIKGAIKRVLEEFKIHVFMPKSHPSFCGVSFSAGLAAFPDDGSNLKELLVHADNNLYAAKRSGRSRICDNNEA